MGCLSLFYLAIKYGNLLTLGLNTRGRYSDYYLATFTLNSNAKKKELLKRIKGRPNDVWVSMMNDPSNPFHDRARVVQVFIGKADFFFCHWYAESEQVIIDKLASIGADDLFITMAVKTKKPIADTDELEKMRNQLLQQEK